MSFQDDQVFLEKYLDENLNTVLGLRLAERYISTDNLEGAHQTLTEFLESHPDNATAMFLLGEIAFKEGNNEKAKNLYEETIQADPSYTAAYHRLVSLSTDDGNEATVKDIYSLLNRVNPMDSKAAVEVGDEESDTSLKSEFSKKVLNQIRLTTAEPEEESIIKHDSEPIEPTEIEDAEENVIGSDSYTEPTNIPLDGTTKTNDVELESVSDEESPSDLDSGVESEQSETAETDETSSEDVTVADSEETDAFGVSKAPDEPAETDKEDAGELIQAESEDSIESEIEDSEDDNAFGVGAADEAGSTEEEPVEEESPEESQDVADEEEEITEEKTEEEPEDEKEEEISTEEIDSDADKAEEAVAEEEEITEEKTEEEPEDEKEEDISTEEIDTDADKTEEETINEATDKEEEPFGSTEIVTEDSSEAEESPNVEPSQVEESGAASEDLTEEDEVPAEEHDISDSIVDKEARGFEMPPFSKETLSDIQSSESGEAAITDADEENEISSQDKGANAFNIPLESDSDDESENEDNLDTTAENMIDDAGAEEHNIPIDQQTDTEGIGFDTPSDYESWVDKDVTPDSMTSGGSDIESDMEKRTFEGLLSEPDAAVETLDSEIPAEEDSEGIIDEEVTEDFHKKVDNIYNLEEEEEISPLQAWFLERKSSEDEEQIDSEETSSEDVDPPLTEPMPVPFSDKKSEDASDSDKSDEDDNGEAWDNFVETAIEGKTDSGVIAGEPSEDTESIVTEVDRELQNIFDDVVSTDTDDSDKKEDETEKAESAPIGGVKLNSDLATFTLAEIYTNQGQYTEALSVLDLLENKGENPEKIASMRKEIKEKMEAKNK